MPAKNDLPANLKTALAGLPPSHRREYMEWIDAAKKPETRQRRMARAVTMISSRRNKQRGR